MVSHLQKRLGVGLGLWWEAQHVHYIQLNWEAELLLTSSCKYPRGESCGISFRMHCQRPHMGYRKALPCLWASPIQERLWHFAMVLRLGSLMWLPHDNNTSTQVFQNFLHTSESLLLNAPHIITRLADINLVRSPESSFWVPEDIMQYVKGEKQWRAYPTVMPVNQNRNHCTTITPEVQQHRLFLGEWPTAK